MCGSLILYENFVYFIIISSKFVCLSLYVYISRTIHRKTYYITLYLNVKNNGTVILYHVYAVFICVVKHVCFNVEALELWSGWLNLL